MAIHSAVLLWPDEPSLGLAPIVKRQIFARIRAICDEGTTVVLVEQNGNMALRIADYAYVLVNGRIAVEGPPRRSRQAAPWSARTW
ncbi:MAG TPA: hypothetical protein VKV57_01355 [bacterium]|nr:hypothetical protein [bacterium]